MAEIVGEASGENAWKMIMETGGYDKDRTPEEFAGLFYETQFYLDKVKAYQLPGASVVTFPGGQTWDGVKGELWEVSPIRQKLASYRDMAAMLATGSTTGEATGELVWVGSGPAREFTGKDVAGKIVVTEGSARRCTSWRASTRARWASSPSRARGPTSTRCRLAGRASAGRRTSPRSSRSRSRRARAST